MKTRSFCHGATALALVGMFACDTGPVPAGGDTEEGSGSSSGDAPAPVPDPVPDPTTPPDDDSDDTGDDAGDNDSGRPPVSVCGDGLLGAGEECDGDDFGDRSCGSEGAEGGTLRCTDDCLIDTCDCEWDGVSEGCEPPVCGNGIQESGESCDGSDIPGWDFHPCDAIWPGGYGAVTCTDTCSLDLSACMGCGDGFFDAENEWCDGAPPVNESGEPLTCAEELEAPYDGLMGCSDECELTDDLCEPTCGNGQVDADEECDGDNLAEATCESLGAASGELSCTSNCTFRMSGCEMCGNGSIDGSEECDGDDLAEQACGDFFFGGEGSVSCTADCDLDISDCEASTAEVVISEVMIIALPAPLLSDGEWLELYNPHPTDPFPLAGCSLQGSAPFETEPFDPELSVPPGGYLTFGEGSDEDLGFTPDGVLASQNAFLNEGDTIRVVCSGFLIDEVDYDDMKPWPEPVAGVSIVLRPDALSTAQNDQGVSWCAASPSYAEGYFGTPGGPGGCEP